MNNTTRDAAHLLAVDNNTAWEAQTIADFDGDGDQDIFWKHKTKKRVKRAPGAFDDETDDEDDYDNW